MAGSLPTRLFHTGVGLCSPDRARRWHDGVKTGFNYQRGKNHIPRYKALPVPTRKIPGFSAVALGEKIFTNCFTTIRADLAVYHRSIRIHLVLTNDRKGRVASFMLHLARLLLGRTKFPRPSAGATNHRRPKSYDCPTDTSIIHYPRARDSTFDSARVARRHPGAPTLRKQIPWRCQPDCR